MNFCPYLHPSFAGALGACYRAYVVNPANRALAKTSQSGGTGRRARLKIVYPRMCGFDSRLWYSMEKPDCPLGFSFLRSRSKPFKASTISFSRAGPSHSYSPRSNTSPTSAFQLLLSGEFELDHLTLQICNEVTISLSVFAYIFRKPQYNDPLIE
jgi:hypothetical protein